MTLNLQELRSLLFRRWWIVALPAALGFLGAVLHYRFSERLYRAQAAVEIVRQSDLLLRAAGLSDVGAKDRQLFFRSQNHLVQSRGFAERVVRELRLWEDPEIQDRYELIDLGQEPSDAEIAELARSVLPGLTVTENTEANRLAFAYQGTSPELVARMAGGYAEVYKAWAEEGTESHSIETLARLDEQIETLQTRIREKEEELGETPGYESRAPGARKSTTTQEQLRIVVRDHIAAYSERVRLEAGLSEPRRVEVPEETAEQLPEEGPRSRELRDQLQEMRARSAEMRETFKPDWPALLELEREIRDLQQEVDRLERQEAEVASAGQRSDYQTALRREQQLARRVEALQEQLRDESVEGAVLYPAQVELQSWRSILSSLARLRSRQQVAGSLEDSSGHETVRLLNLPMVPQRPFSPNLQRNVKIGVGAGAALGLALVVVLYLADRTFKNKEQLEHYLQLPALGVIPDVSGGPFGLGGFGYGYGYGSRKRRRKEKGSDLRIELLPLERPRLAVSEAYRSLRTALLLSSARKLKVISMTSAEPGEGKSTTCVNLAVVLAQLGRSVVLVDVDMRKPRQHKVFEVSNTEGLVNVLVGAAELEEVLVQTHVPNLQLLPAGPAPPNPSELIASGRMVDLIQELRFHYDYVLLDTPPILAVADPIVVGALCDGTILCTQAERADRDDVRYCRDRLRQIGVHVLGVVLNRFREPPRSRASRYYDDRGGNSATSASGSAA